MVEHIHPDYDEEDLPLTELAEQSPAFLSVVNELVLDENELGGGEYRHWLSTHLINGKLCQAQVVLTSIPEHFTDEG